MQLIVKHSIVFVNFRIKHNNVQIRISISENFSNYNIHSNFFKINNPLNTFYLQNKKQFNSLRVGKILKKNRDNVMSMAKHGSTHKGLNP